MTTDLLTQPTVLKGTKNARLRHIVEKTAEGYADRALCGYLWDILHANPNGTLCEECEKEYLRRTGSSR